MVGLALVALGSRFSIGELRRGISYKKHAGGMHGLQAADCTYTMYVSHPWTAPPAINQPAAPDALTRPALLQEPSRSGSCCAVSWLAFV